jgi:hypothetical protein
MCTAGKEMELGRREIAILLLGDLVTTVTRTSPLSLQLLVFQLRVEFLTMGVPFYL